MSSQCITESMGHAAIVTVGRIGEWGRLIYVQIVVSFPDMFHSKSHVFISSSNPKRLVILIVKKY